MKKGKILVTGGAGFIGSNIVEELVAMNKEVVILDDFSTGFDHFLTPFKKKISVVKGDIRDPKATKKAMKDVRVVIHQAAIRSVPKSVDNPFYSHEVNGTGTLVLLSEAIKAGVKRFVYASSSSVYGNVDKFPQVESDTLSPLSPYGVSKLCGENYCHAYHAIYGLETVALRYFNVYGPRQNPESLYSAVVPAFIDKVRRGQRPVIDGDGKQSRDFTYVKDVARANIQAALTANKVGGESFNIASGHDYSVNQILELICKNLNKKCNPIFGPRRKGDALRTYANISKAKKLLDWTPQISLQQGLERTIQWFLANDVKQLS